jgi:hypothetical protein
VYVITTEPIAEPETTPDELTGAIAGLLLLHVPPPEASLKETAEPIQTVGGPEIAATDGKTVNVVVVTHPGG